jgi:hypothetical protein
MAIGEGECDLTGSRGGKEINRRGRLGGEAIDCPSAVQRRRPANQSRGPTRQAAAHCAAACRFGRFLAVVPLVFCGIWACLDSLFFALLRPCRHCWRSAGPAVRVSASWLLSYASYGSVRGVAAVLF